ncbi:hypothetical protein niasHT_013164 [Heterodera trifolii]|uniref:Uncharacterized protein n=1 Tax=Heterodera trifolii TaxID=157864 RepID=A0ABD2KTP9_9BILA
MTNNHWGVVFICTGVQCVVGAFSVTFRYVPSLTHQADDIKQYSTLLYTFCYSHNRIANQLPNTERIARSNVVFCSLWDYSETERQVQKALNNVKERLRENDS